MPIQKVEIGDCREIIKKYPDNFFDCLVTSPPYWGLRDYKTKPIIFDGVPDCEHEWGNEVTSRVDVTGFERNRRGLNNAAELADGNPRHAVSDIPSIVQSSNFCSKCGAWRGQLGLEPTPELFIKHLLDIFTIIEPKIKNTGSIWINLGDSYYGSPSNSKDSNLGNADALGRVGRIIRPVHGILKPKSLCMIPSRFAWGMIERGWILRNEIIWAKPNHMPESVTDRMTKAHEVIYHFVMQQKYYYDLDAIREPLSSSSIERISQKTVFDQTRGLKQELLRGNPDNGNASRCNKMVQSLAKKYQGKFEGDNNPEAFGSPRARTQRKHQIGDGYRQGMNRDESDVSIQRVHEVNQKEIAEFLKEHIKDYGAMDAVFGEHKWRHWIRTDESGASLPSPDDWKYFREIVAPWLPNTFDEIMLTVKKVLQVVEANVKGKNPGDIWYIPTTPYPESHFAVFPLELVRRPILAGCPIYICKRCGKPRERIMETITIDRTATDGKGNGELADGSFGSSIQHQSGWSDCGCGAEYDAGWVLDPFTGSGTTLEFCRQNNRNCVGIEVNMDYKPLIVKRARLDEPQIKPIRRTEIL